MLDSDKFDNCINLFHLSVNFTPSLCLILDKGFIDFSILSNLFGNINKTCAKNGFFHKNKAMNFWELVDEELKYKNIDRKKLASIAGFNVSNISKGIRENNVPSADTAVRIARVLGVSVEYLVTGENNEWSKKVSSYEEALFQKYKGMLQKIEKLTSNERDGIQLLLDKLCEK